MATADLLQKFKTSIQTKKNSLGVLVEKQKLYTAHLSYSHKKISVNALATIDLHDRDSVKPLDIIKNSLFENCLKRALIVSGFSSPKTLSRTLDIQSLKPKEMDAAIAYQIEPHLPYPLSECCLEKVLLSKQEKREHYLVVATQKSDIKEHLEELKGLNIDPEIVAPKAQGLIQFAHVFLKEENPYILIDISPNETSSILFSQGIPLGIRSLPFSLETGSSAQETNELKTLARELTRVLMSFQNILGVEEKPPIIFTGPVEQDPLILSLLAKLLGHETHFPTKVPKNVFLPDEIALSDCFAYACTIGLALLQSPVQKQNFFINFRKNDFFHPHPWQRWKKEFALYFALMGLLSLTLFLLGENYLKEKMQPLYEKYAQVALAYEKTPQEIEALFQPNTTKQELSVQEIEERLSLIEAKFTKPSEEMPLYPNIPRVFDLLAWLQELPKIIFPKINLAQKDAKLKLESFHYQMVKRPEKGKTSEKYQVRIDLEFTTQTPELAKEILDLIKSPNPFVNPSEELKWQAQKNRYQLSFFLKDFTQYQKGAK